MAVLTLGLGWTGPTSRNAAGALPYEAEIQAFEAADRGTPPPPDPVLLVGSSTFTRWTEVATALPGYTVLNRGFGGSQLPDVLNHFDRVVRRYQPPLIVLYEGDNDLSAGRSVDQVFGDWIAFVSRVQRDLPASGVVFLSVKPSPSRSGLLSAQRQLNARIKADCASRSRCRYVEILEPLLDAAGRLRPELYVSDLLHLNAEGYAIVTAALQPALEAWAAAHPERSIRSPLGVARLDFGAADQLSGTAPMAGSEQWNNISPTVGAAAQARVANLVTTAGVPTTAAWVTTSRFNGANTSGTTAPAPFPSSATRDSLFGNTEVFSGLANLTPAFKITGLRPGMAHRLTFYASRLGASDNRETRYTVTGATTASVDLDVANNVAGTAEVPAMIPDSDGAIAVALAPGPRNNNANHFVYLGVLRLAEEVPGGRTFLFDLGAADSPTGVSTGPVTGHWNDVTPEIGADPAGVLPELKDTVGDPTGIALRMVSRFNGANLNGTTAATVFPASATRDSLFGNAEAFDGLAGVVPAFRLTGLRADRIYSLAFHASRTGVNDHRETRYVVRGIAERVAVLEPANNTNALAWVTGMLPDEEGALGVSLEPGPGNDSANHFTYLGTLQLEWRVRDPVPPPVLARPQRVSGGLRFRVTTAFGRACRLERSGNLISWTPFTTLRPSQDGLEMVLDSPPSPLFLRAVDLP